MTKASCNLNFRIAAKPRPTKMGTESLYVCSPKETFNLERTRGPMNRNLKALAGIVLASAVTVAYAQPAGAPAPLQKHHTRRIEKQRPSIEQQIEELQEQMNQQREEINSLRQQLDERNAELKQAQATAEQSQTAAQQAQSAADRQKQQLSDQTQAVTALQSAVAQMKQQNQQVVTTVKQTQAKISTMVEHPDAIHYKGITISPAGSFLAAETDYRTAATGGGLNTAFTGIPLDHSPAAQLSEFNGTGRQSRIALKATGKAGDMQLTGYYEMDWLGTGITSNNNQSNSYVVRVRQLWGQAALDNGWTFTGGQMWSLTAETTQGLNNGTEILPATIDPQYEAGYVWNRQYGFRVTRDIHNKVWFGASAENDQMLLAGNDLPKNELVGSTGNGGGLYNPTANYSFNLAPEIVAKMAVQPGWGHWELFGVARFFQDRVYPTGQSPYNDSTVGGGIGGSVRGPVFTKKISVAIKGLYGDGTGRMGSSTIADATLRPDGQLALLHTFSALSDVTINPNKRLSLYFDYGGDYAGRRYFGTSGEGYGSPYTDMSGCNTESVPAGPYASGPPAAPAHCGGNTKDVQEFTAGDWYNFYNGPKGMLRFGLQYSRIERNLWSGIGGPNNPDGGARGIDNMFFTSFRYYLP